MDQPTPRVPSRQPRVPDPGTPKAARVAFLLTVVLIAIVAWLQQSGGAPAPISPGPPATQAVEPPRADPFLIVSKTAVKIDAAMPMSASAGQIAGFLDESAAGDADRVRAAVVIAELQGGAAALSRLDAIEASLPIDSPLRPDIAALRAIYAGEVPSEGAALLDQGERDRLVANHGWFGELALTYGQPDTNPARAVVIGGGRALLVLFVGFLVLASVAMVAGFVLLVTGTVLASAGRLRGRFVPPAPGGSVAIETVAVFVGGFILLKLAAAGVAAMTGEEVALWFTLLAQWLLVGALVWPVVRGVTARASLRLWGLERGQGVLREVGCGVLGYLASLPLYLFGVLMTFLLMQVQQLVQAAGGAGGGSGGAPPLEPPANPVIELVARSSGSALIVLIFVLATVWAPLVEESVFRGALFRHLRGRWHWSVAALLSATAFALMHGYGLVLLPPLVGLGFGFAMIREWRGSLLAPMTAHFLHNATLLAVMIAAIRLLGI